MPSIVDVILVGELALLISSSVQLIKSHPKVPGSSVPVMSGIIGIIAALLWYLVNGLLYDDMINWINLYRGVAVGIIAAVTSIMGYNLQKALPTPNLLPTSGELNQQRMKESVATTGADVIATTASFTTEVVKTETSTLIDADDSVTKEESTEETTENDKLIG